MRDVTRILQSIESGDRSSADQLLPLVYDELRKLAAARLAQERPGQTLQATALVHDAYLALVDSEHDLSWESRAHFFGAAAEAMRRILINNAIRKRRPKHGGDLQRVNFDDQQTVAAASEVDLVEVDAAIEKLAVIDPDAAQIVRLKFYAGVALPQIAEILHLSPRTVDRRWAYARAWLHQELQAD